MSEGLALKAFVGNLDRTATVESVQAVFAKYNKPTIKKKGRGRVVTFASAKLVAKAIEELNGKVVDGVSYGEKGLRVQNLKDKAPKKPAAAATTAVAAAPAKPAVDLSKQAFVGNLDGTASSSTVRTDNDRPSNSKY